MPAIDRSLSDCRYKPPAAQVRNYDFIVLLKNVDFIINDEQTEGRKYDYQADLSITSPLKVVVNADVIKNVVSVFASTDYLDEELTIQAATMYAGQFSMEES